MTNDDLTARILIIEDEYILGLNLAAKLEEIGYQVCGPVSNGESCLNLAVRERPDLVLMNMALSGYYDGLELADLIRRRLDIPVVFITTRMDEQQLRKAKVVLPFGFLIEPFQHKDLQVAVEMALYFSRIDRERRDTETALKLNEEKYRLLVDNPLNAIAILQDHHIVFANQKLTNAAQTFQIDHTNHPYLDFVHPEDLDRVLEQAVRRRSGQDVPETIEFRLVAPNGSIFWMEGSGAMVDWEGRPAHLVCIRNITEKVAAKEALQSSEEQHRQLISQLADPVLVIDRATHGFLDCNPAAVQHYGYSREEFLQMTPFDLHLPEDHELVRLNIDDETDFKPHHYTHLTKAGRKMQVETHTNAGTFQGRPAWITVIRDISERLRAENLTAVLYGILQAANLAADPDEYYGMIHQRVGELIDAKNFFIALHDPVTDSISFPYFVDEMDTLFEITNALDSGSLTAEVIRTGRALLLDENGMHRRFDKSDHPPWGTLSKCWLAVPLILQGQVIGALGVQSYRDNDAYDQSDLDLLAAISHQIALVIGRKQAEEEARRSAEQARVLLNTPYVMAMLAKTDGTILDINQSGAQGLGKTPAELIGTNAADLEPKSQSAAAAAKVIELVSTAEPATFCQEIDGWYLETAMYPILDENGVVDKVAVFTRDTTEQKEAADNLKATVKEKEVLLREIHHRVKNNMQVIMSLLNLQTMGQNNPVVTEALLESQSRVGAMALVHETLYQSESLAAVDLNQYISGLVRLLSSAYGGRLSTLRIKVEVEDGLTVGIDQAVPCGLVLHELVSNAIKHAFVPGRPGIVSITACLNPAKTILVTVRDNGRGWPANLDWRNCGTLGLKLVVSLVEEQLAGKLDMIQDSGTTFVFTIPRP